jgi:hypothetical protein
VKGVHTGEGLSQCGAANSPRPCELLEIPTKARQNGPAGPAWMFKCSEGAPPAYSVPTRTASPGLSNTQVTWPHISIKFDLEILIIPGYDVTTFGRFLEFLSLFITFIHFIHFLFLSLFLPLNLPYFLSSSFIAVRYTRYLLISLFLFVSIFPFINLPIHLPFQHSTMYSCICLFLCLSVCLPVCLSVCLSIYPFINLSL